jgi:hypothetical protein
MISYPLFWLYTSAFRRTGLNIAVRFHPCILRLPDGYYAPDDGRSKNGILKYVIYASGRTLFSKCRRDHELLGHHKKAYEFLRLPSRT